MGLDVKNPKPAASTQTAAAPATMLLTPAIYSRYVKGGILFEKGTPYRFTQEQANLLLQDVEAGTDCPIWKVYKAPQAQAMQVLIAAEAAAPQPVDMTTTDVKPTPDNPDDSAKRRLELGSDSELADVLGPEGAAEAGVKV